ncbi:glycosyltransferase family 4 protein [Tropicimonas sediminicola]|uniref:Glycosyltransferase involved in cell wall bisynthesis n=1 Tax=Tropicimonas sediminicola TaxID=1031541 RepID=A0A239CY69_9RHOB|nr:glycosyltransferase family 4 protein [Tropicimonas sediminicola]SNS24822.1 Glycosyltransferase involved in cell wall bisynthesis [Tropicimonas sediminicola]
MAIEEGNPPARPAPQAGRSLRVTVVAACPFPARRGTPIRVERLTEAFVTLGHDVELVTYHIGETDRAQPFPVHRILGGHATGTLSPGPKPQKLLWYDPSLVRLLRRRIAERPPDVLYAHHFEGVLVAAAARGKRPIPIVYDAHTMLASELPTYHFAPLKSASRRVGRYLDRAIPARADHIVTVTVDIRSRLVEEHGFDPSRITVAMNGVEADVFSAIRRDAVEPDTVVYTGTLSNYQGFEDLLRAFRIARSSLPDLRLKVYSNASFTSHGRLAESLGVADAVDVERDDFTALPGHLARGALAALPRSHCDGIPQKLLNYMAAGMPIVAFQGSAKVLGDGRTGMVVQNGDVDAFADAIVTLSKQPELAERLGANARADVLGRMTWEAAARRCQSVFDRLVPQTTEGGVLPEALDLSPQPR